MTKVAKKRTKGLSDPTVLKPVDKQDGILQVIIETPKGKQEQVRLRSGATGLHPAKVLPAGMIFPYDFGFLPRTLAQDGDPIDVLLLMDEPAYPASSFALA